jgi:hypothetical protein
LSFRKDELAAAQKMTVETFESAFIKNDGSGHFSLSALPKEAQMSPVFGMLVDDVNHDGHLDLLCVGNSFSTEVQTGRYDAQASFALLGDGRGGFSWQRHLFYMDGDAKSIAKIRLADGNGLLLVGRNSDALMAFKMKNAERNQPGK